MLDNKLNNGITKEGMKSAFIEAINETGLINMNVYLDKQKVGNTLDNWSGNKSNLSRRRSGM